MNNDAGMVFPDLSRGHGIRYGCSGSYRHAEGPEVAGDNLVVKIAEDRGESSDVKLCSRDLQLPGIQEHAS